MKNKINLKFWSFIIALVVISTFLIFYSFDVISLGLDIKKTNKKIDEISELIKPEEIKTGNVIGSDEEKTNPYWSYIKLNLTDVDLSKLKKMNNDTVGYLSINNTKVNFPFVQSNNNEYYLKRSFDKSKNEVGWVFMDSKNKADLDNKNTIIYFHGKMDNTKFVDLKYIIDDDWFSNTDEHVVRVSTEESNTLWQIFSLYRVPINEDYLQTEFKSENEYKDFLDKMQKRSNYNFNSNLNIEDKIITISIHYSTKEVVVLHAKLIKVANK